MDVFFGVMISRQVETNKRCARGNKKLVGRCVKFDVYLEGCFFVFSLDCRLTGAQADGRNNSL